MINNVFTLNWKTLQEYYKNETIETVSDVGHQFNLNAMIWSHTPLKYLSE